MKVTKLKTQKKDPSRVNMYIDEEFVCGVSLNCVAEFNLYPGKDITNEEVLQIQKKEIYNRFLSRAMGYLSRTIRTEYQIRRYLKDLSFKKKGLWYTDISKEEFEKTFNEIIEKIKSYGYIDDAKYAEQFILSRTKNKPRGKSILISELMSKGVSKEIAFEKVEEMVEDEYEVLDHLYRKKYKEEVLNRTDRKKINYLQRKGFSWDLIERYMNNEFRN